MTKEEVIETLRFLHMNTTDDVVEEALEMAIKVFSVEPCEDAVSRAEVLKIYNEWFATCNIADKKESPKAKIKALPPVYPAPKTVQNVLEELKQEFCNRYPKNAWSDYQLGGLASHFSLREVLEILDKYADKKEGAEVLNEQEKID